MQIEHIASTRPSGQTGTGIVHLGLGAFHRAHQAVYLEQYLAQQGGDWGICSANIRANQTLVKQLKEANCRYQVVEYRNREQACVREIRAIREALFAGSDAGRAALLQRLTAPETRIVTLTVTEKGYYLEPSAARLRLEDPAIQHDLARPHAPKTAPGLLLEALNRRRLAGTAPFTVLSCDNMPHNGRRTRAAVLALAQHQSPELHDWIETRVCFPGSMVDRIVPAMAADDFSRLARELDCREPTAVICESFSQWVVEDNFSLGRPDWEIVGVQMVADVTPFETMKLRMLNGSHSLLAYLGPLAGYQTVAQAMRDPEIRNFIHHYMLHEAVPTLEAIDRTELHAYAAQLLQRFANDSLQHQLHQIAMDGSQKLPQRWLDGCQILLDTGQPIECTALGLAAWIMHVQQAQSKQRELNDPLAPRLLAVIERHHGQPQELLAAFLAQDDIFTPRLAANDHFKQALTRAYNALQQGALSDLLQHLTTHSH